MGAVLIRFVQGAPLRETISKDTMTPFFDVFMVALCMSCEIFRVGLA